jgi:alkanesulfonate monooxygenase SsuD/methylene tetrahydromethanopterin reductase-like flavin-dependent oxidoreductase (luciferase family)
MIWPSIGCISVRHAQASAADWRRLVARAESVGLDHLGAGDHVSFRNGAGSDGLLAASRILGLSDRLSSNTGVYLLPLRNPVIVARQLADIAAMAPDRFIFGVGVGGEDRREIEACGVDPRTRGQRMDEYVHVVRELLTGRSVDFAGRFVTLSGVQIAPAPAVPIAIVVGGRSSAANHRAAMLGDGWFGIWVSPSRYRDVLATMQEIAHDAGRIVSAWTNALNVWCAVGAADDHLAPAMHAYYGIPYERFERWSPAGTPEQIAEFLYPYAEAGCSVFNLIVTGPSAEDEIDAAAAIRDQLRALVGEQQSGTTVAVNSGERDNLPDGPRGAEGGHDLVRPGAARGGSRG